MTSQVKRLHAVRAVNSTTRSQKDSVDAYVGSSSAKVLTKRAVLGIFPIPDFRKMDVPLIGCVLTRDSEPG